MITWGNVGGSGSKTRHGDKGKTVCKTMNEDKDFLR